MIPASELILNPDGSIYHLHLRPEDIAHTIITVGDPDRVDMVARYFDEVRFSTQKREFATKTGRIGNKELSVISTGIGTDNIDIVFNELDALVNIDLSLREVKPSHTQLSFIRIGTSGALQKDVAVDSFIASSYGIGFDGLLHFYEPDYNEQEQQIQQSLPFFTPHIQPYVVQASKQLLQQIGNNIVQGITATCSGFYAPQGRQLRLKPKLPNILDSLQQFRQHQVRITNFEMETAGIYGLAKLLGHKAISMNAILANRPSGRFSKQPKATVAKLINLVLERISEMP